MTGNYNIETMLAIADQGPSEAIERLQLEVETLEFIRRGLADNTATAAEPHVHVQSALDALHRCIDSLKEIS